MIIYKPGAVFEYNGKQLKIGESVVGTDSSKYAGLNGTILAICDGKDKGTEYGTPDVYCRFAPPVFPCDIKNLEGYFSCLHKKQMKLEEIPLDPVTVSPDMIEPVSYFYEGKQNVTIYLVQEEWAFNGGHGVSVTPYLNRVAAKRFFNASYKKEQESGYIHAWKERDDFVVEMDEYSYECYLNEDYNQNHYSLSLQLHTVPMCDAVAGKIGRAYIDQSRMEDFASNAAEWDKAEALSDEQFQRFISDPSIPDRIEKKLGKNDPYWESYWDSISDVAHELLNEYLKNNTHPDCFTPEPDNPYPLCIGNGEEQCRQCCLYVDMEGEGGHDE